jgi:hypothetical protein
MRIEQAHLFLYGALLCACAWGITLLLSSARAKFHIRAIFLAIGLGCIVVPGHGEIVLAPILAGFMPPLRSQLIVLGGIFALIWWVVSFYLLKLLTPTSPRRADTLVMKSPTRGQRVSVSSPAPTSNPIRHVDETSPPVRAERER